MEEIEQPKIDDGSAQPELSDGSIMGKFKDATSLQKAYLNLQAEFTRKSQKLAELEKLLDNKAEQLSKDENAPLASDQNSQDGEENIGLDVKGENSCCEQKDNENSNYEADLSQKLLKFAENVPDAINYLQDIKEEIAGKNELANIDGGLDIAYRLAASKHLVKPAELLANPEYITDYILKSDTIKQMVIDNYIKSLASGGSPKVIGAGAPSTLVAPNPNQPKTLSDANKIFSRMLEK